MVAMIRIVLLVILVMALMPPWRGRPGSTQHSEESAGYAFLFTPPRYKEVPGNTFGWADIRIDVGRLMVQCLIVVAFAGLVASFRSEARPAGPMDSGKSTSSAEPVAAKDGGRDGGSS